MVLVPSTFGTALTDGQDGCTIWVALGAVYNTNIRGMEGRIP